MALEDCAARICRLCDDETSEEMISVFDKNNQGMQIVNVIKECLAIIIYRTDPLSKYICEKCNDTLYIIFKFKQKALSVLKKYQEKLKESSSDSKNQTFLEVYKNQNGDVEWKCDKNVMNGSKVETKDGSTLTDTSISYNVDSIADDSEVHSINSVGSALDPSYNGLLDDTATESDVDTCDTDYTPSVEITSVTKRKKPKNAKKKLCYKKRKLENCKPKVAEPRYKNIKIVSYNPLSLLQCVLNSINKSNIEDYECTWYEKSEDEIIEEIPVCSYCGSEFDSNALLAQHELKAHIRLELDRVDELELWDKNEKDADFRNLWLKKTHLNITSDAEEEEEEDDEEIPDEDNDNLLVPMEDSAKLSTERNANISYVDELPTLNGVLLSKIPRDERYAFYQSVRINGMRRKFCNLCRYTFKDNWAIELHYMSKTCYFTCNYCGMKFNKNKPSFQMHVDHHVMSGDKKSDRVFVNRSKSSTIPKMLPPTALKPYIPQVYRERNKVKPIKMKSLLERNKIDPDSLQIKSEVQPDVKPTKMEPMPISKPMTTLELAQTASKAYFCKKCYQVFCKLDEYNIHNSSCNGMVDDPEMKRIRPYKRKREFKQEPVIKQEVKVEKPAEQFSPTGRPIRNCVREVVTYNDEKETDFRRSPSIEGGRFECNLCCSVFPTVHSRNSHMRIHKAGFKHARNSPAIMPREQNYNTYSNKFNNQSNNMIPLKKIKQESFEPIVEIHEGHSSKIPQSLGSVSITPIRKSNKQLSPAIMQLVQNNPNITLKPRSDVQNHQNQRPPPQPVAHNSYNNTYNSPAVVESKRMYNCSSCNQPFANKSNLYFHKKNHCGGSKYPCPFCKKRFGTEASYSAHIFYSHPV